MRRCCFFLAVTLLTGLYSLGQSPTPKRLETLAQYQDSLKVLGFNIVNNPSEPERYNASYTFIKTLIGALRMPNSFNYPFDSLKTITIQKSPDHRFRIFSWHVMNNDGSYRYYGTIQMNAPAGKLQMFPLVDHTADIKKPQDTVLTNDRWYGAQYYRIIPVTYNVKVPYYILLGWKGNTVKSTKKVIDILYFKDNKACFGMPLFDGNKDWQGKQRVVFEYSRQASMMLNYLPKEEMIVFDHLAAPDPAMQSNQEAWGPDLSYDGLKLDRGRLKFRDNIVLKNSPSASDDLYIDPKKPQKETINRMKESQQ